MMKFKVGQVGFFVSFPAVAFFTLALICNSDVKVLMCFAASILHETGHIIAMKAAGVKLNSISFSLGDVAISAKSHTNSYWIDILISVSGPLVNVVLCILSLFIWLLSDVLLFKTFLTVNLCIAVFNLLPVRFLDGGQILLCLFERRLSPRVSLIIINVLSVLFLLPVGVVGFLFIFVSKYNYSLLFASIYLICTLVSKELR